MGINPVDSIINSLNNRGQMDKHKYKKVPLPISLQSLDYPKLLGSCSQTAVRGLNYFSNSKQVSAYVKPMLTSEVCSCGGL